MSHEQSCTGVVIYENLVFLMSHRKASSVSFSTLPTHQPPDLTMAVVSFLSNSTRNSIFAFWVAIAQLVHAWQPTHAFHLSPSTFPGSTRGNQRVTTTSIGSSTTDNHQHSATTMKVISTRTVTKLGGILHRVKHASQSTQTEMVFSIFLPSVYAVGSSKTPLPAICE